MFFNKFLALNSKYCLELPFNTDICDKPFAKLECNINSVSIHIQKDYLTSSKHECVIASAYLGSRIMRRVHTDNIIESYVFNAIFTPQNIELFNDSKEAFNAFLTLSKANFDELIKINYSYSITTIEHTTEDLVKDFFGCFSHYNYYNSPSSVIYKKSKLLM